MSFLINTYMLSNRVDNADCSSPGPVQYMTNINFPFQRYNEFTDQNVLGMTEWITELADDLFNLYSDKNRPVILAFYIHGFDLSANDARIAHAWFGSRLYATGLDQGLVVGASWPSNCDTPYWGRQYAEDSANLMEAILNVIPSVKTALTAKYGSGAPELTVAVITHSMGNYLMSTALAGGTINNYQNAVDCVLMLAPDVDYSIFSQGSSVLDQGQAISEMANGLVWVFWTWNDEVLEADEQAGDWYVLGYRGPETPIDGSITNVEFVDSGDTATEANGSQYVPYEYGSTAMVHSSYRFVTQLVYWQVYLLVNGRADETLEKVIAGSRPGTEASPKPPNRERLDTYIYRTIRKRRPS